MSCITFNPPITGLTSTALVNAFMRGHHPPTDSEDRELYFDVLVEKICIDDKARTPGQISAFSYVFLLASGPSGAFGDDLMAARDRRNARRRKGAAA